MQLQLGKFPKNNALIAYIYGVEREAKDMGASRVVRTQACVCVCVSVLRRVAKFQASS